MSNSSTSPGYLTPLSEPLTRAQLEDVLHDLVVGITGMDARLVRPRFQPEPPKQPEREVDWCAIGIQSRIGNGLPHVQHAGENDGTDAVTSWKDLAVQVSFYGPAADDLADRLSDGLAVEQNRTSLRAAGLALVHVGEAIAVPEQINHVWVRRVDLPLTCNLEARRVYRVQNLLDAPGSIEDDVGASVDFIPLVTN